MSGDVAAVATDWLASTGAPNGLVLLAVLTSPATWSRRATSFVRRRLSSEVSQ
jgi:hypothetical protein